MIPLFWATWVVHTLAVKGGLLILPKHWHCPKARACLGQGRCRSLLVGLKWQAGACKAGVPKLQLGRKKPFTILFISPNPAIVLSSI